MNFCFFFKKVLHFRLHFRTILLIIATSTIIIFFNCIIFQPFRTFKIASILWETNQNLKSFNDSINSTNNIQIYNVSVNNKNLNFNDENNLAGKYAEFLEINQTISFENEFRWPPFDVNLRNEVDRALNGQAEVHPRIDHWSKFPVLESPKCPEEEMPINNSLLIMVRTGAERIEYRNAIRETYGLVKELKLKDQRKFFLRLVFVMGNGNDKVMNGVREEIDKFNDILLADFEDNYYTCTIKVSFRFIHAIKFGHQNCFIRNGSFPYVLLIDDNYFFLPWNLAEEAIKHDPNENLYMGGMIEHSVARNNAGKWSANLTQYPFDEYPKFVSGGAVLFSKRTNEELFLAIQHTQLYIFDDVYTGILTKLLGIQPQPNSFFMSDNFSTQIPNSNKTVKLINANDWWKTVIAAMDYSPEIMRKKYYEADNLFQNDL